jgi:metallophosphoesterase (TIGR00282 family)
LQVLYIFYLLLSAKQQLLPQLRTEYNPDVVLANVENLAHGFGITPETINDLHNAGVDLFTSGNHIWDNSKGVDLLATKPTDILRPENFKPEMPGLGWVRTEIAGAPVLLMNLMGEVFMNEGVTDPFETFDRLVREHGDGATVIVDLHAEATGEKRAFGWHVDGRASLVVGTHTHIQTADEEILTNGTGYISDLGNCGATRSSLGMDKNLVVQKVAQRKELNLEPPEHPEGLMVNGIVARINTQTHRCESIERIDRRVAVNYTSVR